MKCNICGGDLPEGEITCKYCGNIMSRHIKKEDRSKENDIKKPVQRHLSIDIPLDATVQQQHKTQGIYCRKCGRPLDGITHKCIVCDAAQVSKRAYENDDFKNREMNIMAQKKKKKEKNNSIRNAVFAIAGMILIFMLALSFASNKLTEWLGIGSKKDDVSSTTVATTATPKVTADPNWKPSDENPQKETPEPTELPTKSPVRTPVPIEPGDPVDLRGGEYEYPSDTTVITEDELKELTRDEIKYIYWEIYARHGYSFDADSDLGLYFEENHNEWYMPNVSDKTKVESEFNSIEKRNITTIEAYQKKMGWRQ